MITQRSLQSPRRRLPELRRAQAKLRTLKRTRYARKMCTRRIGSELAINRLLEHIIDFLQCTFSEHLNDQYGTRKTVERMIRALRAMQEESRRAGNAGTGFSSSVIRQYGSASSALYQKTRRLPVNLGCDEAWQLLGYCAHVLF